MFTFKRIPCSVLLMLVFSVLGSAEIRLCGNSLLQFMEILCSDRLDIKNLNVKRSVPLAAFDQNNIENNTKPTAFAMLFLDKFNAAQNSLTAKTRQRRQYGLVDACCRNSCTLQEIVLYCPE